MKSFNEYMNEPVKGGDMAKIEDHDGVLWVHCPYCGRKVFPVGANTTIHEFFYQCPKKDCKQLFEVNI